jgi:transcriptional regulator with XRE-family HTH domain
MTTTAHEGIRELRRILGQTQEAFAAMIGASKDTVVSWETGRNKLSAAFALRIGLATGADPDALMKGIAAPQTIDHESGRRRPYAREDFERHRREGWGRSDEEAARRHLKHCGDTLELLFVAALKRGKMGRQQLPAVLGSFVSWCEQTREDFGLEEAIEEQLKERVFEIAVTQSYRGWRELMKDAPAQVKAGFRDDGSKANWEELQLVLEVKPGWAPGRSMRGPKVAIMETVGVEGGRR